ncbi:MAG: flagellar basal body protein [Hyphomicrobium aestuarii]|nr:flagellar basal body protein [Hyphomicrobium aestuarii]
MSDIGIFTIGHERMRWLASRVAVVASNVANADTPGYRAKDIPSFEEAVGSVQMQMSVTSPQHLAPQSIGSERYGVLVREQPSEKHSGNSVSLDGEMAILGESRGQQAAVAGIMGSFNRMLLSSVRGGA